MKEQINSSIGGNNEPNSSYSEWQGMDESVHGVDIKNKSEAFHPENPVESEAFCPDGWVKMAVENRPTKEDEESGLVEFLAGARDEAAEAIGEFCADLGIEKKYYERILNIPIGIEKFEAGAFDPGVYAVLVGRESDEILAFYDAITEEERGCARREMSATIAHEMVHAILTGRMPSPIGGFGTMSDLMQIQDELDSGRGEEEAVREFFYLSINPQAHLKKKWYGLEEGMAEVIGRSAVRAHIKGENIADSIRRLENACKRESVLPATQVVAHLLLAMMEKQDGNNKNLLKWCLTCVQDETYKSENLIRELFGEECDMILGNITMLMVDYEKKDEYGQEVLGLINKTVESIDMKEKGPGFDRVA